MKELIEGLTFRQFDDPEEIQSHCKLLDQSFGLDKQGIHFVDDFPIWSTNSNRIIRFGAFEKSRLLGALGVRIAEIKVGAETLRCGCIGAVTTDTNHRGKGICSRLLKDAEKIAQSQELKFLILWGSEHDFYSKRGYKLFGKQVRTRLCDIALEDLTPPQTSASPWTLRSGWNARILKERSQSKYGFSFDSLQNEIIPKHKSVQWLWSESESGFAYLGIGRGIDLPNIIHEWGGSREGLLLILREVRKHFPKLEMIGLPKMFDEIGMASLRDHPNEYVCLLKPCGATPIVSGIENELWFWGLDSV